MPMKFIRYTILLLTIATIQLLIDWPFKYTPELLYLIAFISSLNTTARNTLINLFLAGMIADFFIGQHLGINALLFISSSVLILYFKNILHSKNGILQLLLLGISLIFILISRTFLINFCIPAKSTFLILLNNFIFSLLISPALALVLKVPIICPWKKRNS